MSDRKRSSPENKLDVPEPGRRAALKCIALGTAGLTIIPLINSCSLENPVEADSLKSAEGTGTADLPWHLADPGRYGENDICAPCCEVCRKLYWDKRWDARIYTGEISVGDHHRIRMAE